MSRADGREAFHLRPVTIDVDAQRHPAGSALVRFGGTHVLCAASQEDGAPRFRDRKGWVTGEYAMLPGATDRRARRERNGPGGRSKEIERLVGRSLRSVVDLDALPDITLTVDCDVLEADGGTRTAAITGGWVALARALRSLGLESALTGQVAAVSVGVIDGEPRLDLPYEEDVRADVDMNVVATGNAHKLGEIRAILDGLDVELVAMTDLGLPSPVEDGDTFEANALIKARACAAAADLPALADDSGLEVDALGGAPGVRSARYAGEDASDQDNNTKLVAALADTPEAARTGRFVCAAALVTPEGEEHVVRGAMEGHIVDAPRGTHGFGYDPHFVSVAAGDGRTNGELTPAEKDAISHRGAAFRALRPRVEAVVTDTSR